MLLSLEYVIPVGVIRAAAALAEHADSLPEPRRTQMQCYVSALLRAEVQRLARGYKLPLVETR